MEYLYLFLSAFISATLLPFGSEALLLYDLTLDLNIVLLFVVATFGNSLGSVVNYWLGLKGEYYLESKKIIKQQSIQKAQKYFDKYGAYSLLLSWVPVIGDPITFVAGLSKYNFKKFIFIVFFAKGLRYLFVIVTYYLYI
ncbi:MAG TPA: DedA family protein [Arcobacter sp.]|nr:DedA family protein [Arcobacter sp.]